METPTDTSRIKRLLRITEMRELRMMSGKTNRIRYDIMRKECGIANVKFVKKDVNSEMMM